MDCHAPAPPTQGHLSPFPTQQLSLWPSRPRPEADELLSSWMIRLAHANGHKVQPFYRFWLGAIAQPLWARDVDRSATRDLIDELAVRTGIPVQRLEDATLRSLQANVFHHYTDGGHLSWLMPLGIFHRDRRRAGLMCCPACLKEDREPYFRKVWRLSFTVACVRHGTLLVEQCSSCRSTIQPHRADHRNRSWLTSGITLAHCWNCSADLRDQATESASEADLELQRLTLQAVDVGHVDATGRTGLHSILFLKGLRVLVAALLRMKEIGGVTFSGKQLFETLDVWHRSVILKEAHHHLVDWPVRFQKVFSEVRRAYSQFTQYSPDRPYWIDQEVELLNQRRLPITQEEIDAITRVIDRRNDSLKAKHISQEFGRDLSRHIARSRVRASEDYANSVLDALDHEISVSQGIDRLDLIRDRTMLLSARILGLSQRAIGEMKVEDLRACGEDDLPLETTPADADTVQAYLRRFVRLDRRHYDAAEKCPWLFPCRSRTGKMSESLVNTRYANAIRVAKVRSPLPYRDWVYRSRHLISPA